MATIRDSKNLGGLTREALLPRVERGSQGSGTAGQDQQERAPATAE